MNPTRLQILKNILNNIDVVYDIMASTGKLFTNNICYNKDTKNLHCGDCCEAFNSDGTCFMVHCKNYHAWFEASTSGEYFKAVVHLQLLKGELEVLLREMEEYDGD